MFKEKLSIELNNSHSVWIASAMISRNGWSFIQNNLPDGAIQSYLIGIDLATDPSVFESILKLNDINARVYETKYTFHPKVYLIKKNNNIYTAFVGSSNTTGWGLEKNIEMNFQIMDQKECKKLLDWFNSLYSEGYLITDKFVKGYKIKYEKVKFKAKEIEKAVKSIKIELSKDKRQFFTANQHAIFNNKYHISSIWLHYGKSSNQLRDYQNGDETIHRPDSFINNIRMQIIIHEESLGIWLVIGRNNGSKYDRENFQIKMKNRKLLNKFYHSFKNLGKDYWLEISNTKLNKEINSPTEILVEIQKDNFEDYFIIGCEINWLDKRLSINNLPKTVLEEFRKLYPLYEIIRHKN